MHPVTFHLASIGATAEARSGPRPRRGALPSPPPETSPEKQGHDSRNHEGVTDVGLLSPRVVKQRGTHREIHEAVEPHPLLAEPPYRGASRGQGEGDQEKEGGRPREDEGALEHVFDNEGPGETLVEIEERAFLTMSLAGTQRYHENEKVAWGQKELEEQRLVTDQIRKELGSMLDHVGEPFTQQAGHLLHLRTNIRGRLQEDNLLSDLISRLHPTAAICGLPREQALEFIQRNEGYSREYYSGFLGEVHYPVSGSAHLFVNLRCMQLFPDAKQAWVYVGGGITASSQPEKEWEETRAKSETMKRVFS